MKQYIARVAEFDIYQNIKIQEFIITSSSKKEAWDAILNTIFYKKSIRNKMVTLNKKDDYLKNAF